MGLSLLGMLAFAAPSDVRATGEGDEGPPLRYRVRADAELRELRVELCFRGAAPRVLVPGVAAAGAALLEARDAAGRALPIGRGRIGLAGVPPSSCVHYRVDLDASLRASRFSGRFGSDLMTSAGVMLWRPARLAPGGATLRFELPDGMAAATPWPEDGGTHRLELSAFQRPSFVALGRFAPQRFTRSGADIEVVRLGPGWRLDDAGTERFLARAIDGVSTVRGRFPVLRLLVVLVPSESDGVHFGMVRRGGGPSVAFLMGRDSTGDALERSWVTWHELSHLHLPPLPQRDAWLYEGLATYYQEVLRARTGVQTPEQAWAELADGFDRGARTPASTSLTSEAETMMRTGAFQRVYWAGTAFVLEADVALRARGGSLDAALARASTAWRRGGTPWTSERLCALFDRTFETGVMHPLRARYAARTDFPDVAPLFSRLGVRREGGRVELRDAELAGIRDAIMRAR